MEKKMMAKHWSEYFKDLEKYVGKIVLINQITTMDDQAKQNPWLKTEKLVVKPDQLIGKRGKSQTKTISRASENTYGFQ
jgi:ATP-citrate lyase beta-subunit